MTEPAHCQLCGQRLPETRMGVKLSPLKARIFDAVRRAGRIGIDGDELFALVFAGRDVKRSVLKSHVSQINDALAGTDVVIRGRVIFRLERGSREQKECRGAKASAAAIADGAGGDVGRVRIHSDPGA
jgi:hypothetical protein